MFRLFKRKPFFAADETALIVDAIRSAEQNTSGEIRFFVESRCKYVNALDRAVEIFYSLEMDETEQRNGVLVYLAVKDHQLAIFGDKGIYERVAPDFWEKEVQLIVSRISADNLVQGLCNCVKDIGMALQQYFPYSATTDKNELPDEIVFGN